jgi:hypothetical protein
LGLTLALPLDSQSVRREIQRAWLRFARRQHWAIGTLSPSSFQRVLPPLSSAQKRACAELGPWLPVYELAVQWLANVSIALSSQDDRVIPTDKSLHVPWALLGSAAHYSVAIRQLTALGFDSPARAQLRTLVESLLLCLASLDDQSLAEEFQAATTDKEIKNFWHTRVSPKNLHLRVMNAERRFGLPDDWIRTISRWRTEEHAVFSEAVHLSYVAAVVTVLSPDPGLGDEARYGVLGKLTSNSERTLSYGARTIWHFCILGGSYLFDEIGDRKPIFSLDQNNPLHQALIVTRHVLMEAVLDIWKAAENNKENNKGSASH